MAKKRFDIEQIKVKATTPGWGYDGDDGSNEVVLFLIREVERWKVKYLNETVG